MLQLVAVREFYQCLLQELVQRKYMPLNAGSMKSLTPSLNLFYILLLYYNSNIADQCKAIVADNELTDIIEVRIHYIILLILLYTIILC